MFAEDLQLALGPFELTKPVLEWLELIERAGGINKSTLSRLLFSLEAFIERVGPDLRREAESGDPGWWPAVHEAEKLIPIGRKLGLTDARSEPPIYRGRFVPKLFTELLGRIQSLADSAALRQAAATAMEMTP